MKTLVHIGYPKTASSFLQLKIFSKHPDIYYPGLRNGDDEFDDLIRKKIIKPEYIQYDQVSVQNELSAKLNKDNERICVISAQGLCSMVPTDRGVVARRIKNLLPDAKILICIRNQIDWITSVYAEHRKQNRLIVPYSSLLIKNRDITIAKWFEHRRNADEYRPLIKQLDYWPLIDLYMNLYGKDNVHVLLYEELKADQNNFINIICNIIGVDSNKLNLCDNKINYVNKRMNSSERVINNLNNKYPFAHKCLSKICPDFIKKTMRKIINVTIKEEDNILIDEQVKFINEYCKSGNNNIEKVFNLNLKKYGYSV